MIRDMTQKLDAGLALASRLSEQKEWPLKELYLEVAEELDMDWNAVRAVYREMKGQGLVRSYRGKGRTWYAFVKDPEGNLIEVVEII